MIQSVTALISSGKQIFDQYLEVFLFSQEILKRVQIISRFFLLTSVLLRIPSIWEFLIPGSKLPADTNNFNKFQKSRNSNISRF